MAKRIAGIALMPRESRNGIYYDTEELKKFDGVQVPLRVEHGGPSTNIGMVTFTYDEAKSQVKYEATVDNLEWQEELEREQYQVSIGASVLEQRELCDAQREKCLNSPILKDILELSLVKTPGIPESTLAIVEHFQVLYEEDQIPIPNSFGGFLDSSRLLAELTDTMKIKNPDMSPEEHTRKATELLSNLEKAFMGIIQAPPTIIPPVVPDNTSNIETPTEIQHMTTEISKKIEEKVKVTIETDGEVEVGKAEAKTEVAPVVEAPAPATATPEVASEKVAERIEKSNADTLKAVIETVSNAWKPKSEVAESTSDAGHVEEAFTDDQATEFMDKLFESGYNKLVLEKEGWIQTHTSQKQSGNGEVQEAVSTSGTISGVKTASNISIQLGAKTAIPIRQYGQFQAVPVGQNTARFYRITVPDAGAITESPTTDITASTHTLTSIDVTCSIRGWRQTVEKAELEDYPASFLNAIRETARLESIRDEHKLILQDLASTARDFGGVTTAPYHIGGSDGAATSNPTEEDADAELDEDGLTFSKRYLEELGQDTSPGNLIAFISPRAFEALISSTSLSEYTQIGNASVTRLGQMERLYGIDIIVTNELLSANNASRNLVCVKGKAWGLASQRKMEIEFQKNVAGQYWDIVWTHRIGVNVIDANTYVIVSTVNA
jgi:hypothetical protein|tara:strand:+ start:570 stop:2567 length:1998 start_codon:yes stop_codon:yes gene_type:complete